MIRIPYRVHSTRLIMSHLVGLAVFLPLMSIESFGSSADSTSGKRFSLGFEINKTFTPIDGTILFKLPNLNNRPEVNDVQQAITNSERYSVGVSVAWKAYEHPVAVLSVITRAGLDFRHVSTSSATLDVDSIELAQRGYRFFGSPAGVGIASTVSTTTLDIDMGLRLQFKELPFMITLTPRLNIPLHSVYRQEYKPDGDKDLMRVRSFADGWNIVSMVKDVSDFGDNMINENTAITSSVPIQLSWYSSVSVVLRSKSVQILPTIGFLYSPSPVLNTDRIHLDRSSFSAGVELRVDI
ncbi:MAG: hypothetical protein JNL32_01415 [Candidatus Kapabacteria bacterium]|nr:hypothetical protein [Candidatus Kapabacteria bacterium]